MTRGGFPEPIPSLAVLSLPACRRQCHHHGEDDDDDYHHDLGDNDADVDCQEKKVTFSQSKGSDSRTCQRLVSKAYLVDDPPASLFQFCHLRKVLIISKPTPLLFIVLSKMPEIIAENKR